MRTKCVGNKADRVIMNIRNGEASTTIPRGTPVVLKFTNSAAASGDGLDVVLPSTAGDGAGATFAYKYGVATDSIAVNQMGESILFGVCTYAIVVVATRGGTSGASSWPTASQADGVALGIDSLNNAFIVGASIAGSIASNNAAAVLIDSFTVSATATATNVTNTAATQALRVFVRML